MSRPDNDVRNAVIVAMYKAGETLETCGQRFGLTRERARQIIKAAGVAPTEGGQKKGLPERQAAAARRREAIAARKEFALHFRHCGACGETKPIEEFARHKNLPAGRQYRCKACNREKTRDWYHEGGGKQKNREWQRNNPEKMREYTRRWKQKQKALAKLGAEVLAARRKAEGLDP